VILGDVRREDGSVRPPPSRDGLLLAAGEESTLGTDDLAAGTPVITND